MELRALVGCCPVAAHAADFVARLSREAFDAEAVFPAAGKYLTLPGTVQGFLETFPKKNSQATERPGSF